MERLPWEGRHSLRICFLVPKNPRKNPRKSPKWPSESEATVHCKSMRQKNRPRLCLVQWEMVTIGNLDLLFLQEPHLADGMLLHRSLRHCGVCHSANEEVGRSVSEGQTRGTCGWQLHTLEPALRETALEEGGDWKDSFIITATTQSRAAVKLWRPTPFSHSWRGCALDITKYLCFIADVPGEGDGIVSNLFDVADGVEAFFVVSYMKQWTRKKKVTAVSVNVRSEQAKQWSIFGIILWTI